MYCKVPIAFSKGNNWNPPKSIKNLFLLKLFKMKFGGLKTLEMSTSLLVVEVLVYEQLEKRRFPIRDLWHL